MIAEDRGSPAAVTHDCRALGNPTSKVGVIMQFHVTMRDGAAYDVEASYVEVYNGPSATTYALLGPVPGYPVAILATFPADLVESVVSADHRQRTSDDIYEAMSMRSDTLDSLQVTEDVY
jgi:hypothetical protein